MLTKEQRDELRHGQGLSRIPSVSETIALLDALDEMERERDAGRQREEEIGAAVSRARPKCNGTLARCVDALAAERDRERCEASVDRLLKDRWKERSEAFERAHDDLKASRDYWLDQSEALKRERAVLANERDEWKARAERQRIIISAIGDHILENQGGEVDAAVGSAVQSIDASTDLTYSSVRDILHDAV